MNCKYVILSFIVDGIEGMNFMKRKLNSFDWSYISIVAIDANGCPWCVAKGIACVKRHDAYVFAVKAMLEMALGKTSDEVLAVFADGMLCSAILENDVLGFRTAKFLWDSYRLLHDIWPKQFGVSWDDCISSRVEEMLYSDNE